MLESRINKSCMTTESVKQINQLIIRSCMWGPHQSPVHFCMDQIREFHYSELRILILCLFQNIFFFKQRRCENGLPERKWRPIFIKNVIFRTWNLKDENLKCKTPGEGNGGGARFRMWDIRRRQNIRRTEFPDVRHSGGNGGGTGFRMWDIRRRWNVERIELPDVRHPGGKGGGEGIPGARRPDGNGGGEGFRVWDIQIR